MAHAAIHSVMAGEELQRWSTLPSTESWQVSMLVPDFRCNHECPESKGTSHHLPSWQCRPDSAQSSCDGPRVPITLQCGCGGAASRTPSLCQLRHAARWDPEDSARGQVQAGRGAEPDGGSHHLSPPHPMLICKHSGKSLSLFKVDEGWYPLYTFSPLLLHLHSSGQTCAGALRCIVSTSVKSVMEPKVLINNPDEARKF